METGAGLGADSALEFRKTLGMFATGIAVITTQLEGQVHGMTANALMSVSLQPPLGAAATPSAPGGVRHRLSSRAQLRQLRNVSSTVPRSKAAAASSFGHVRWPLPRAALGV